MSDRYAPAGKVWLCMMCGKTAKDYCADSGGWDESCALNCILVDEATKTPTNEQVADFHEARNKRMAEFPVRMEQFRRELMDGTYKTDPELLKLAQEAIDRRKEQP